MYDSEFIASLANVDRAMNEVYSQLTYNKSMPCHSTSRSMAFLLLLLAAGAQAQDNNVDRASWMREARWGVMNHYLADWIARGSGAPPLPANPSPNAPARPPEPPMSVDRWNDLVDHFNVDGLAMQLQAVGAGYYQISIGQNSGYYLAPNAAYDRLTGITPSHCSRRDLVADLAAALSKRGIRLMVYLPAGAPNGDAAAKQALGWQSGAFRNREFQQKWEQVIREWSSRWGNKVSGWWFDGVYWPDTMYRTVDAPNFDTFAAAARAGNPSSALAFNPGVFYRMFSVTPNEDFVAGEVDDPTKIAIKRSDAGKQDGKQIHVLTFMGDKWGFGPPRLSADQAVEYSRKMADAGGVITWDVPLQNTGLIAGPYLDRLAAIGHAMGRIPSVPQFQSNLPVNYDEAKAGTYTLPDVLTFADGSPVRSVKDWPRRRAELLKLFETNIYGRSPEPPKNLHFEVTNPQPNVRKVILDFGKPKVEMLLFLPQNARKPVPVLLQLSFSANDAPAIRTQAERVLSHGYAFATIHYTDFQPDNRDGLWIGVRALYAKPGQTEREPDEWGTIAAWAWGANRAVDYLVTDRQIDPKRIALTGMSRLGKTVLWAGASDTRFAMIWANCSGEGGAALARRDYGETAAHMGLNFGYQYAVNYRQWGEHIDAMPTDQHELLALIAPRPFYLATGEDDRWSDPRGEFLSAVAAGPVYKLFGKQDLGTTEMPAINQPIMHDIGYHCRTGRHEIALFDWESFLKFMDMHWGPGKARR